MIEARQIDHECLFENGICELCEKNFLKDLKFKVRGGQMTLAEATKEASAILERKNKRVAEIAEKYGRKVSRVTLSNIW